MILRLVHYTRNQHVVPQFYLREFATDEYAWACRRDGNGLGEPFRSDVSGLCSRRDYFEVKRYTEASSTRFLERGAIEGWLSRVEGELAPHLHGVATAHGLVSLRTQALASLPVLKLLREPRDEEPNRS